MWKFLSLGSGSNGNCYYFDFNGYSFLIDAGVGIRSCKRIMQERGLKLDALSFILVTHDHADHIKALGKIAHEYEKPVYTTENLKEILLQDDALRARIGGNIHGCLPIDDVYPTDNGDFYIETFNVPHDAKQTVGFALLTPFTTIVLVTDCGAVTEEVMKYASMADILIFEANYDKKMLEEGRYPIHLKERIERSGKGHLSNDEAAKAIGQAYLNRGKPQKVFLCHLSGDNNTPDLAKKAVVQALKEAGLPEKEIFVEPLKRGEASLLYTFEDVSDTTAYKEGYFSIDDV